VSSLCGPSRAQESGAEARTTAYGSYARYQLALPGALPEGKDLILHLGRHDDTFLQAWGEIPGNQQIVNVFDQKKLTLSGGRLRGRLRNWIKLDEFDHTYICLLDIDARIAEGKISGRFESRYSVLTKVLGYTTDRLAVRPGEAYLFHYGREVAGKVTARAAARFSADKAHLTLWTRHLLEGSTSFERYAVIEADVKDSKVAKLKVYPRRSGWTAGDVRHDLTIDGNKLGGTITFNAKPTAGGTLGGTYVLTVSAAVGHNVVRGSISATRNGRSYRQENGLSGVADSGPAADPRSATVVLEMPRAIESTRDLRVHIDRRGGKVAVAVGFNPTFDQWFDVGLTGAEGETLPAELTVKFPEDTPIISTDKALAVTYRLDVKGGAGRAGGTYRCEFGRYSRADGELRGTVADATAPAAREALRKGFDWPCWNGPLSSFAARASAHGPVDRLADARLVWMSENTFPARCQTTRYGPSNIRRWIAAGGGAGSGGNSPIVCDGRVFFSYFQPVEGPCLDKYIKQEVARGNHVMPIMFAEHAVDVALGIDAATGRTLWRKEIPGGRYWAMNGRQGSGKGWYTTNLAAADGRVYFGTSGDVDYCLDAATGETVWKRELGPTSGRVVIGGVLLRAGRNVVGYDAATGRARWTVEGGGSRNALPVCWRHDGREYVVCGNVAGEVRCVDPSDGRVLWTLADAGTQEHTMAVEGDHLLLNAVRSEKRRRDALGCYRLDLAGAKHLWTLDREKYPYTPSHAPVAAAGGHAFIRLKRPDGLAAVEIATGKVVARLPHDYGASGYVQWTDGRLLLQPDASHSRTPLLWYDVSEPSKTRLLGEVWPTRHPATSSYYPILISHAIADGRIFIRGARGIFCYDLRARRNK
jgi:outer membrane protein assembly factor BamB